MCSCANDRTESYQCQALIVLLCCCTMEPMVTDEKRRAEFSSRFNAALDYIDFPPKGKARQTKLGEWFKVTQKGARKWIEGEAIPKQTRHQEVIEKLNKRGACITGEWLFYGDQSKAPDWYKKLFSVKDDDYIDSYAIRPKIEFKVHEPDAKWSDGFSFWDNDIPLNEDDVALPFFRELEMAGGSGRCEVIENHGQKLRFAKSALKDHGILEENAACAKLSGNSMEPVIPNGTTIGIDKGNTSIKDGKIYAIDHDGHLRVKMLYKLPGGGLRLRSYNNDEWPDERYTEQEAQAIKIIGRVFWWAVFD